MSDLKELTVKDIRKIRDLLASLPQRTDFSLPMRDDIALSVGGVVVIPGCGYMHIETFKDIAGEDAYNELLRRPRVVTKYDYYER
jgi:hypothetical protein